MVAGILQKLGVAMGDRLDPANLEDQDFLTHNGVREVFTMRARRREHAAYVAHTKSLVAAKARANRVWGWKDPLSSFYIRAINQELRAPYFILVTRDITAIAGREQIEEARFSSLAIFDYMETTQAQYAETIRFLRERARPTLLVSYERALRAPADLARALARFLGLEITAAITAWAATYVVADRGDAALDPQAPPALSAVARAASDNLHLLLEESARILAEPSLRPSPAGPTDPAILAQRYVTAAAAALASGHTHACRQKCFAALQALAYTYPALKDGVLGLIADILIGTPDQIHYPTPICQSIQLIGESYQAEARLVPAIAYLRTAEFLMRGKAPPQYWRCLFHLGAAARALNRQDIVQEVQQSFARGTHTPNTPEYAEFAARAAEEYA